MIGLMSLSESLMKKGKINVEKKTKQQSQTGLGIPTGGGGLPTGGGVGHPVPGHHYGQLDERLALAADPMIRLQMAGISSEYHAHNHAHTHAHTHLHLHPGQQQQQAAQQQSGFTLSGMSEHHPQQTINRPTTEQKYELKQHCVVF